MPEGSRAALFAACAAPTSGRDVIALNVNGADVAVQASPDTSLLLVLRNDCELNSPKYGCGLGECGACTVLIDGVAARACVIPISGVAGRYVTTVEGLAIAGRPGPVQQAFIEAQAAQCGYCLAGMMMMTASLLATNPDPTALEIRDALSGNLCRCGTHVEIIQAVKRAAVLTRKVAREVTRNVTRKALA